MRPPTQFLAFNVCARTGATPRQLRYWDQTGLVRPSVQGTRRTPGVPRIYSREDLWRVRAVVLALGEGWSLQRIHREWDEERRGARDSARWVDQAAPRPAWAEPGEGRPFRRNRRPAVPERFAELVAADRGGERVRVA